MDETKIWIDVYADASKSKLIRKGIGPFVSAGGKTAIMHARDFVEHEAKAGRVCVARK